MPNEQLAKKEENLPAVVSMVDMDLDDIEIPSLRLLQPTSEKSNEDGYNAGDYLRSTDDKVMANKDKSFGVFILSCQKMITKEKYNGNQWEWIGIEPFNLNTYSLEEYQVDGERRRDMKTFIYTVLLADEINNKDIMPATIQMKSSGIRTAKKINTRLMNNRRAGKDEAALVIEIGVKQEKNPKGTGTYFVPTFKEGRKTTDAELVIIQNWRKMLSSSQPEPTGEV